MAKWEGRAEMLGADERRAWGKGLKETVGQKSTADEVEGKGEVLRFDGEAGRSPRSTRPATTILDPLVSTSRDLRLHFSRSDLCGIIRRFIMVGRLFLA